MSKMNKYSQSEKKEGIPLRTEINGKISIIYTKFSHRWEKAMKQFLVLVTARSFGTADDKAIKLLEKHNCKVQILKATEEASITDLLSQNISKADGIIAGLEPYTDNLLEKAKNLKVISRYGVGYDAVDLQAASKHSIKITTTPGANCNSVSDLAVGLMLSCARQIPYMDQTMKLKVSQRPLGVEMWNKTLGIIGTGRIGQGVIERCNGFNMNILCYDVYKNEDLCTKFGVTYTSLDDLICNSDFISIHTPLNNETMNLFSQREFKMMKKRAVLVNTSRGGIIDEEALYNALLGGEIGAVGLDVTVQGSRFVGPLSSLPNCILTPHAGATTVEASSNMSLMAAENLIAILEGFDCPFTVLKKTD